MAGIDGMKVLKTLDSTVLIYDHSGTGKELIARAIHFNSRVTEKPFVRVILRSGNFHSFDLGPLYSIHQGIRGPRERRRLREFLYLW